MLSLYDLIEINKSTFTDNDNTISAALIEYPGLIERYTVSQLAEYLKVSTASIMRFAKKLGYSGYSELRFDYMKSAHTGTGQDSDLNNNDLQQYTRLTIESLERMSSMDETIFISLAKEIKKHKKIYAIGSGKSGLVAEYMRYSFIRLGKSIETATESVMIRDIPKGADRDDLIIFFSEKAGSASNILREFIRDVQSDSKAKIIIITCNPKSIYEKLVSSVIVIPDVDTKQEGIRSHSLMLCFVDILLAYYFKNL